MKRLVTFTGVDDKTSLDVLKLLDSESIEWGILVSANNTDKGTATRFPSFETIDKVLNLGLNNVSCHICGNLARHYVKTGDFSQIRDFLTQKRVEKFSRFQLNIRGYDLLLKKIFISLFRFQTQRAINIFIKCRC